MCQNAPFWWASLEALQLWSVDFIQLTLGKVAEQERMCLLGLRPPSPPWRQRYEALLIRARLTNRFNKALPRGL